MSEKNSDLITCGNGFFAMAGGVVSTEAVTSRCLRRLTCVVLATATKLDSFDEYGVRGRMCAWLRRWCARTVGRCLSELGILSPHTRGAARVCCCMAELSIVPQLVVGGDG
eukprot:scaffold2834_cov366-Prasinococcus_capsulatus_cf.AAC.2